MRMIEDEKEVIADEPELDLGEYLAGEEEPEAVVEEKSFLDDIPEEDREYAKGWNPNYKGEDAKSLKAFIKDGKTISKLTYLQKKVDQQEADFRRRSESLAKLHEMQLKKTREELTQRRRDAVNMSDLEELDKVDAEIKELSSLEIPAEKPALDNEAKELAAEWDMKNQWINESNPDHPNYDPTSPNFAKAAYANQLIAKLVKAQKPISEIIATVESSIADKFPAQAKQAIPKHLASNTIANRGSGKKILSWSDLSDADKAFFDSGIWATKQEYLQALTDDMESKK